MNLRRASRRGARSLIIGAVIFASGSSAIAAGGPSVSDCLNASETSLKSRAAHKLKDARAQSLICASRTCPVDVRTECTKRVADVNAQIPTIVFEVKDPNGEDVPGVKVTVDGEVFADRLDGTAVPLDPGERVFVFAANDITTQKTFVIREGEKSRHERVVLGEQKAPPPPVAPPASTSKEPAQPSPSPQKKPESSGSGMKTVGLIVGGIGLVGVGVGTYFGITASSAWNSSKSECASPTNCPSRAQAVTDHDTANTNGLISTIAIAAGGAALAGGVILFILAPSSQKTEQVTLAPSLGPSGGGFLLRGAF